MRAVAAAVLSDKRLEQVERAAAVRVQLQATQQTERLTLAAVAAVAAAEVETVERVDRVS
jgi:hypothetical protein